MDGGHMINRHGALIAVLAVAAFGLIAAGCGGDDEEDGTAAEAGTAAETTTAAEAETVAVSMGEFFIKPDVDAIPAGEVTFDVTNDGAVEHEFVVLKTDIAGGDLPVKGGEVDLAKAGEVLGGAHEPGEEEEEMKGAAEEHEEEEHLEPGASESYTVDMEPGKYILICNIPGHYSSGQWVEFTVE